MNPLALGYGRQSVGRARDRTDERGSVSIAYQKQAAESWCERNNATLAGWFQDVDLSGADPGRDGLAALVAEVERVRPAYVLFWDLKRLARNLKLFLDLFDAFERAGAELVSCTEGTRHPAFVWKLLALVGEEERERIAVNITHGKRESAKRGRHLGYAPIGYRLTETSELVPDPETRWIPETLYAWALGGQNPTAICRRANTEGIPTPRRDGPWSRAAIVRILTCPTYAGYVEAGKRSTTRHGQALPVVRALGTHEPLIDPADWRAVQDSLAGRSRPSARRGSAHWLAGRVVCAACGSRLYYVDAGRKGEPWRDRYWRCASTYNKTFGRETAGSCPATKRRISDNRLTGIVLDALESALTRELTADDVLAQLDAAGAADARTMRETAERELAELQRQRLRIADAVQYGAGDLGELAKRDRELVAAIDAAVARLATAPPPPDRLVIAGALASGREIAAILRGGDPNALAPVAVELGLGIVADLDAGTAVLRFRAPYGFLG